jgi:hypothetical protein
MPGRGFADPAHRAAHANLKGRPTGIPSRLKEAMHTIDENLDDLLAKAMELALSGDVAMLSFLLGRRIPMPKPTDHTVQFSLPENMNVGDLGGVTLAILRAVSEGKLDPTSGAKLCSAITSQVHLSSTRDVERLTRELAELRLVFEGRPPTINGEALPGRSNDQHSPINDGAHCVGQVENGANDDAQDVFNDP